MFIGRSLTSFTIFEIRKSLLFIRIFNLVSSSKISSIVSDDRFPSMPSDHDKKIRFKEWEDLKDVENARLLEESAQFSDMLLVSNVDVYRNLPSQLLEFYRW